MAPRKGKKLGWFQALNEYTNNLAEREILDRLRALAAALAFTDQKANLTITQTNKRQKHLEEKVGLEMRILELTGVKARDHLSAVSRASLQEKTQQTSQSPGGKPPVTVPVSSTDLPSERLAHNLRAILQISDAQSSIKSEPYTSTSPDNSSNQSTSQAASTLLSADLEPSALDLKYSSKNVQGNKMPPGTTAQAIWRRPIKQSPAGEKRNPRVPPSAASGGIPNPTAVYLSFCNQSPQLSSEPQQLLLVLDLNGTLLFRHNRNKSSAFIERPSAQQFLNYVFEHFNVMIWSSAQLSNVDIICRTLIAEYLRPRLVAVWGREHIGLSPKDFFAKVQVYKRLDRIWNSAQIQARHPQAYDGRYWNQANTVLIDDSEEKSRSEPHNFVRVEEFVGKNENPNILRNLAEYLATLRMQADVSSYIRHHPFNASPTAASFTDAP